MWDTCHGSFYSCKCLNDRKACANKIFPDQTYVGSCQIRDYSFTRATYIKDWNLIIDGKMTFGTHAMEAFTLVSSLNQNLQTGIQSFYKQNSALANYSKRITSLQIAFIQA